MKKENSDEERAFLLLNKIVGIIKEYSPLEAVSKINLEIPKDYPVERIKQYFSEMGIIFSAKITQSGKLRIINIELKE